jgi:hypothetical protein
MLEVTWWCALASQVSSGVPKDHVQMQSSSAATHQHRSRVQLVVAAAQSRTFCERQQKQGTLQRYSQYLA